MELQATKLEAFNHEEYTFDYQREVTEKFSDDGHFYYVTDGIDFVKVMEWDNVASGECADSHVTSNEDCGSFRAADVLMAIRKIN